MSTHTDLIRWSIDKKVLGRGIAMAFQETSNEEWYLIPHDEMVTHAERSTSYLATASGTQNGRYHRAGLSRDRLRHFSGCRLGTQSLNESIYAHHIGTRTS